ncbi:glycoside hydrolase domain-containing protein [Aestuariibaculum sediminum]|uniref:DUF4091 domain-containing protein n=1 Tax=Aestuariibaculum sediminum TaxID=2770637 RepID=A0A8J6UHK0_9FLAO|nr:glycoside hydrolase domain-containing protein [Aestuariibaculum sediminum]MBD0832996.1 DUF4091 domain-containing protein [Aestuariibaculum sediminum]
MKRNLLTYVRKGFYTSSLCLMAIVALGCSKNEDTETDNGGEEPIAELPVKTYINSTLSDPGSYRSNLSDERNLVMAKGEIESFQLALELDQLEKLEFIKTSANNLLNFTISEVLYFNGEREVIVPIDEPEFAPTNKVLTLLVTYEANRDIDAGTYVDELTIKSYRGEKTLTFTVDVKDVTIPVTPSIPLAFGIYQKVLTNSTNIEEIYSKREEYFELCFKNRLSPYLVNWGPPHRHLDVQSTPYDWNDPRTAEYLKDPRFAALALPFYDRTDQELLMLYNEVETAGLLDKSYVYYYDEPRSYEDHAKVLEYAEKLAQLSPELKIQLPIFCGMTAESNNIFEVFDYYKDYPLIINTGYYPLQSSESRAAQCLAKEYEKQEWWTYTCCGVKPGFTFNTSPVGTRSMMWRSWKEQSKGFLYWAVNNYESIDPDIIPTWTKPGDGHLVYRGHEFGKDYPVATLRLERFRDGEEDYELLKMIEEKYGRAKGLELLSKVYRGPNQQVDNAAVVEAFRVEMLNLLASN